jgi:hypothetical protein
MNYLATKGWWLKNDFIFYLSLRICEVEIGKSNYYIQFQVRSQKILKQAYPVFLISLHKSVSLSTIISK